MTNNLDIEALIGLAVCTAFIRLDFDSQTLPLDVEEQDAWNSIAGEAMNCLQSVGINTSDIKLDKNSIALAFWGMDADELEEMLQND
jgi:hypothetical protein